MAKKALFKRCSTCGLLQEVSKNFDLRSQGSADGYRNQCKRCMNLGNKPKLDRARHLRRKFGITPAHYDLMMSKQGGVCAICHGLNKNDTRLAVDHCHRTNQVRGLLCTSCNQLIGAAGDEITILEAAIKYLLESNVNTA